MNIKGKYRLSGILLSVGAFVFMLNYILNGWLSSYITLNPGNVISNYQLWRLLTFPLAGASILGFSLFVFTFWLISPQLEKMLGWKNFGIILGLVIFLQGLTFSAVFWSKSLELKGMEGVSFFILTLFTSLQRSKKVMFMRFRPVRLEFLFALMIITWTASLFVHSFLLHSYEPLITNLISAIFGILTGFFIFLQIKISQNFKRLKEEREYNFPYPPIPSSYQPELVKHAEANATSKFSNDDFLFDADEDYFSEERLNKILDKINDFGKESLSLDELQYLNDYSNYLNL